MSRESAIENKVGVLARENVSRLYWHLNENTADTAMKTTTRSRNQPTHTYLITNYFNTNTKNIPHNQSFFFNPNTVTYPKHTTLV